MEAYLFFETYFTNALMGALSGPLSIKMSDINMVKLKNNFAVLLKSKFSENADDMFNAKKTSLKFVDTKLVFAD